MSVITAFGRLGKPFAAQRFDVMPDIITTAKGLTNGVIPMGAVLVRDYVYEAFMQGPEQSIEFFHGYTYSGHPVAAAAGAAALDVYREEGLFARAAELEVVFEDGLHSLGGLPHVIDIRNIGLVGAVELEAIDGKPTARALDVFRRCYDRGVMVRTTGDIIALTPPLIISETQIEEIVETLRTVLSEVA